MRGQGKMGAIKVGYNTYGRTARGECNQGWIQDLLEDREIQECNQGRIQDM